MKHTKKTLPNYASIITIIPRIPHHIKEKMEVSRDLISP